MAIMVVDQRRTRLVWHPGTVVPGGTGWAHGSSIDAAELPRVLATFNGGFTFVASRGGIRDGHRLKGSLRVGAASLLIDAAGRADVRAYDAGRDGRAVLVRQNLDLLVDHGVPASTVGQDDSLVWGKTLHHRKATARTAAGVTATGELVIVLVSRATTAQLAAAMVQAGAVRAMELDINPQFTCLLTYRHGAGSGVTPIPVLSTQQGSVRRYLTVSKRDFFSLDTGGT